MSNGFSNMRSYADLLEKCIWEMEQLQRTRIDPRLFVYSAFNLAVSLDHLPEWFISDEGMSEHHQACIRRFNWFDDDEWHNKSRKRHPTEKERYLVSLYNSISPHPEVNQKQEIVRLVANNAKHFESSRVTTSDVAPAYLAQCGPGTYCGGPTSVSGYFEWYKLMIIDGQGEWNAEEICSELLREWRAFDAEARGGG
jgi:hypothetical protein